MNVLGPRIYTDTVEVRLLMLHCDMCQVYLECTICGFIISEVFVRIRERRISIQFTLCHKGGTNYIFEIARLGEPGGGGGYAKEM
jgi:hypothetical protein